MKLVRFYIGFNDKDSHSMRYLQSECIEKVTKIFNKHYPAFTLIQSEGYYNSKPELSCVVEVVTTCAEVDDDRIKNICTDLKQSLNQECIMVTAQDINRILVSTPDTDCIFI